MYGEIFKHFSCNYAKAWSENPPLFFAARNQPLGVSIGDPGDPPTLFKFSKMIFQFGELVQNFELKRVGVALRVIN